MTDQRKFPFFVNGEFWRLMDIEESILCKGFIHIVVSKRPEYVYAPHPVPMTIKNITFQLAECAEQKYNMIAHWIQGFWIVDPELELDKQGHLYLKGEPK